jgi:hypothetical protein
MHQGNLKLNLSHLVQIRLQHIRVFERPHINIMATYHFILHIKIVDLLTLNFKFPIASFTNSHAIPERFYLFHFIGSIKLI